MADDRASGFAANTRSVHSFSTSIARRPGSRSSSMVPCMPPMWRSRAMQRGMRGWRGRAFACCGSRTPRFARILNRCSRGSRPRSRSLPSSCPGQGTGQRDGFDLLPASCRERRRFRRSYGHGHGPSTAAAAWQFRACGPPRQGRLRPGSGLLPECNRRVFPATEGVVRIDDRAKTAQTLGRSTTGAVPARRPSGRLRFC